MTASLVARRQIAASAALRPSALSEAHLAELRRMARDGTPPNSARALAADARTLECWKRASTGEDLAFPETLDAVLAFVLDHSADLRARPADDLSRLVAETLIALGRRRDLAPLTAATIERRLASWRKLHQLRGLAGPFAAPELRETLRLVRRTGRGRHGRPKKSANAIDRTVLDRLWAARAPGLRGLRDAALIEVAFASGGRRRSEMASLCVGDLDRARFAETGEIGLRLSGSKTHRGGDTPPLLVVRGRAARALDLWLRASGVTEGAVFRGLTGGRGQRAVKLLPRPMSGEAVRRAVKRALVAAGLPEDFAAPHGLRSGFITEAARQGVPLEAAMRLTLHRSREQAAAYYQEAELDRNPAADLGAA